MTAPRDQSSASLSPTDVAAILRTYRSRWLTPTIVCGLLAIAYAVLHRGTWEASQALIIRNEASTQTEGPGRFHLQDEMKTKQETLLEVVKSRNVLKKALARVGRPDGTVDENYPAERDVDDLKDNLKLSAPKGAEFGKTEIFYLKIRDKNRQRAVALASAICDQLQARFQQLLEDRAASTIDELTKAVALSEKDLKTVTLELATLEQEVGSDLGELRMLHGSPSGESDLRKKVIGVENDLREAKAALQVNEELYQVLQMAQGDAGRLLATPNRLLESQPALRRLKDGLVDAQLETAQMLGNMSEDHPKVRAAKLGEQEISQHLHAEMAIALRGLEIDMRLNKARAASLEEQLEGARVRLDRLATLRAPYGSLVANVEYQSRHYEKSKRDLAEARASEAGAISSNLVSRVDAPDTGSRPIGLGRKAIALAGFAGGFIIGLGLLFLTVPSPTPTQPAAPVAVPPVTVAPVQHHVVPAARPAPVFYGESTATVTSPASYSTAGYAEPVAAARFIPVQGQAEAATIAAAEPAIHYPAAAYGSQVEPLTAVQTTPIPTSFEGRTNLSLQQALEKLAYNAAGEQQKS